jgi:hypothetical protein
VQNTYVAQDLRSVRWILLAEGCYQEKSSLVVSERSSPLTLLLVCWYAEAVNLSRSGPVANSCLTVSSS